MTRKGEGRKKEEGREEEVGEYMRWRSEKVVEGMGKVG
jgi:hypothetical protein